MPKPLRTLIRRATPAFKDNRGEITDLVQQSIDSVTYITFSREGVTRGNHIHRKTVQYDFVLYGELVVATKNETDIVRGGDIITHHPNTPHAYKSLTPAVIISMTKGPRKGDQYESDTERLEKPLL